MSKRKKYIPPGTETDGIRRRLENLAREMNLPITDVRMARYTVFENRQWTVREVVEIRIEKSWREHQFARKGEVEDPPKEECPEGG